MNKKDTRKESKVFPFEALRDHGLLWLINTSVFHPRGMALAFHYDEGELDGWVLYKDSETWVFSDDDANLSFESFKDFICREFDLVRAVVSVDKGTDK